MDKTEIVSNSTIQRQSVLPFESFFPAFGNSYILFGRHNLDHTPCIADYPDFFLKGIWPRETSHAIKHSPKSLCLITTKCFSV